jgi:hypothetical protein
MAEGYMLPVLRWVSPHHWRLKVTINLIMGKWDKSSGLEMKGLKQALMVSHPLAKSQSKNSNYSKRTWCLLQSRIWCRHQLKVTISSNQTLCLSLWFPTFKTKNIPLIASTQKIHQKESHTIICCAVPTVNKLKQWTLLLLIVVVLKAQAL